MTIYIYPYLQISILVWKNCLIFSDQFKMVQGIESALVIENSDQVLAANLI